MHMTTLVSATEWGNFYRRRLHEAAQPEFQTLAYQMLLLQRDHQPRELEVGEWHLPFISGQELTDLGLKVARKVSVARCARTSYANFEKKEDVDEDIALHDRLLDNVHSSPFEHPAQAVAHMVMNGNFKGFEQYRTKVETKREHEPLSDSEINRMIEDYRARQKITA